MHYDLVVLLRGVSPPVQALRSGQGGMGVADIEGLIVWLYRASRGGREVSSITDSMLNNHVQFSVGIGKGCPKDKSHRQIVWSTSRHNRDGATATGGCSVNQRVGGEVRGGEVSVRGDPH